MDSEQKLTFKLKLKEVSRNEVLEIEGISFSNIAYILVFVDGIDLFTLDLFQNSFVVFKELKKSISQTGEFLLFTSTSGIADDAGWEKIEVIHSEDSITWIVRRDDSLVSYIFDRSVYLSEIADIERKVENLDTSMKLEPLCVIYPE